MGMVLDGLHSTFRWAGKAGCLAGLVLSLGIWLPTQEAAKSASASDERSEAKQPANAPPGIVKSVPAQNSTKIDPNLDEVTITFDRPMGTGMSWTGEIPVEPSRKAYWKDDRTCVLPVRLEQGKYYRLGINSKSFQNFQSADGTPVPAQVLSFTTEGAVAALEARVRPPKIVLFEPATGMQDVDPGLKVLKITFDVPMADGMSWVGGGEQFPSVVGKSTWSKDGKTCTLPVSLKPGHEYRLGLNSPSHTNFRSKWGVPLEPVNYTFHTRGAP